MASKLLDVPIYPGNIIPSIIIVISRLVDQDYLKLFAWIFFLRKKQNIFTCNCLCGFAHA